ncbi:MAG: hypothetical protein ACJ72N_17595 [Labedaea sp.]
MIAYPGRTFGQLGHRFFRPNDLAEREIDLGARRIPRTNMKIPVLVIAVSNDSIAPERAVRHLVHLLDNSPEVRFEVCPGGHLGVLTGRRARGKTGVHLGKFLNTHASLAA